MLRLIKWVFIVVLIIIAATVGLVLSRDKIAKSAMEQQIRAQTGMDVKIGKLSTKLLSPVATIENLVLYNTAEFGGTPFLNIRELHIEFGREALAHRELHIKLLKLNIAELSVVKNDLGQTNIVSMMNAAKLKPPTGAVDFKGIDVANFSIGKISYLDLMNQKNNRQTTVNLQNQVFRNLNTPGDFYGAFVLIWIRTNGGR
jgi:uncharacterized protein involved in outer membrane biogenesis